MEKIKSLVEARKAFSTQIKCEEHLARLRWPNGVTCPRCGSKRNTFLQSRRKWQCRDCRYQFSVTSGTVFHKTHIDLPRWMIALWMICYSPKGVSSKQVERELGTTYKTAWYMTKRIRWAIQNELSGLLLEGDIEIDEAIVKADGGSATGNVTYQAKDVLGIASRDTGALRMFVLERLNSANIDHVCGRNLGVIKTIYSDQANRLTFIKKYGLHRTVNHWLSYVDGETHVNHVENAWSLFKRGLVGVYHHVSAKHLQEYLDEFCFRCSNRHLKPQLMDLVLGSCSLRLAGQTS